MSNKPALGKDKAACGDPELPEDHVEKPQDADELLAEAMNSLTMAQREEIIYDIHGVSERSRSSEELETPEFVTKKFSDLDVELGKIKKKDAFQRARNENPHYVNDLGFRLKFLRVNEFDAARAAAQLVHHFEIKLDCFGPALLSSDITINDLNEEDKVALHAGFATMLPLRDQAGRHVFVSTPSLCGASSLQTLRRIHFYLLTILSRQEGVQTKGFVFVYTNATGGNNSDLQPVYDWKVSAAMPKVFACQPTKMAAFHICTNPLDSWVGRLTTSTLVAVLEKAFRARIRKHCGTLSDNYYELMTFGIPTQFLPITIDGELNLDYHTRLIEEQRIAEGTNKVSSDSSVILAPSAQDVLMGRSKAALIHPGNLRYHDLVRSNMDRYDAAGDKRHERTAICHQIVLAIKDKGGRFLKQENSGWVCIDDSAAKEKVSTAFRNRRKKINETLEKKQQRMVKEISSESESNSSSPTRDMLTMFNPIEDDPYEPIDFRKRPRHEEW